VKRAFLGILAVTALVFARPAGSEDVSGWQGAKWGMTPDQVQKVLNYPTLVADLASVCGEKCDEGAALQLFESVPAGRLLCTRDRWQARDGYDLAVRIDGAGLSQLAHSATCHRPSMLAGARS
jgi:hypothetical protein